MTIKGQLYTGKVHEAEEPVYNEERALDKQVGGAHYKGMSLQPIEATYLRYGYAGVKAAIHTKVDKYLLRDKGDELENLEKAAHCIALLIDFHKMEIANARK